MFKTLAQQAQETPYKSKYNSVQNLKKSGVEEVDFNLGKFRDTLYSKIQSFNNGNQEQQALKENSNNFYVRGSSSKPKIEQRFKPSEMKGSIPSFDDLLRNMSTQKIKDKENTLPLHHRKNTSDSSCKLNGLQSKIESFGNHAEQPSFTRTSSQRFSSQHKLNPYLQETPKSRQTLQSSFMDKPLMAKPVPHTLIEKLPLRELMEIRSKIENSSQTEIGSLSAGYVAELVKLAQVISKQLKRTKF